MLRKIQGIADIGTCSLPPVHKTFTKGIASLPFDIEQFSNDVYTWFNVSAARREDYGKVVAEELLETAGEFFLGPVSIRWLTIEPVCRRLIEHFPVLKKYFEVTIAKASNSKAVCSSDPY